MRHFSKEARKRMSIAHTGKQLSEEHKRNIGEASKGNTGRKGKPLSEEHKDKLRKAFTGRFVSEETKRKMSEAQKGKKTSEETKKKLSEHFKGVPLSEETKRKMSKVRMGHLVSEETREKFIGEKNPAWNGGTSFLPYSPEWTDDLKQSIKDRDNNECQNPYCKQNTEKLDVHHINYNKQDCSQFNLITLCGSCNVRANANRKEWERFYKKIVWSKY